MRSLWLVQLRLMSPSYIFAPVCGSLLMPRAQAFPTKQHLLYPATFAVFLSAACHNQRSPTSTSLDETFGTPAADQSRGSKRTRSTSCCCRRRPQRLLRYPAVREEHMRLCQGRTEGRADAHNPTHATGVAGGRGGACSPRPQGGGAAGGSHGGNLEEREGR